MKTIIRKCFLNNVNTLKKKKRVIIFFTDNLKFLSDDSNQPDEE